MSKKGNTHDPCDYTRTPTGRRRCPRNRDQPLKAGMLHKMLLAREQRWLVLEMFISIYCGSIGRDRAPTWIHSVQPMQCRDQTQLTHQCLKWPDFPRLPPVLMIVYQSPITVKNPDPLIRGYAKIKIPRRTNLRNPKCTSRDAHFRWSCCEKISSDDCEMPTSCNEEIQPRGEIVRSSHLSSAVSIAGTVDAFVTT
jgi:hypothetical protein